MKNSTLHIMTIVGARPQFVKASVLSRAIDRSNKSNTTQILETIIHTGQHYDTNMSKVFFDELAVPKPSINLNIGSGSHAVTTGKMLLGIERELQQKKPDWVLVYGDTNSTLSAALAAAKLHIPIIHIEAGLRSFNRKMPEEVNRVITDHLSTLLFCPSEASKANLAREGITNGVHVVGDVMYDATLYHRSQIFPVHREDAFALCTVHRSETTDEKKALASVFSALASCPIEVIVPLHPRTKKMLEFYEIKPSRNVTLVPPLPYLKLLEHLQACDFVITDSGGLQKEAYFFGKRCITVRHETEWTELVEIDANKLVGTDKNKIENAFLWATNPVDTTSIYGNGSAGEIIIQHILKTDQTTL